MREMVREQCSWKEVEEKGSKSRIDNGHKK